MSAVLREPGWPGSGTAPAAEPGRWNITRFRRLMNRGTYVPAVDGVRFLAILLVLVHHAFGRVMRRTQGRYGWVEDTIWGDILSPGSMGVIVFFALSGYILYSGLSRAVMADGRFTPGYVRKYFVRRVTRIEPPYLVVLIVLFVSLYLTSYVSPYAGVSARTEIGIVESFAASFAYLHVLIFGSSPRLNPPAWSLEVEVQFYILAPLLALAAVRLAHRGRALAAVVIATLIVLWCTALLGPFEAQEWVTRRTLLRYLPAFLSGMLLCEMERSLPGTLPRGRIADVGALAAIVGFFATQIMFSERAGAHDLIIAVCLLFLLNGAFNGAVVKRMASVGWVTVIGGMCYSIYLLHLPIFELVASPLRQIALGTPFGVYFSVQFLLMSLCALIPSFVFYMLIERPCMNPEWPQQLRARLKYARNRVVADPRAGV